MTLSFTPDHEATRGGRLRDDEISSRDGRNAGAKDTWSRIRQSGTSESRCRIVSRDMTGPESHADAGAYRWLSITSSPATGMRHVVTITHEGRIVCEGQLGHRGERETLWRISDQLPEESVADLVEIFSSESFESLGEELRSGESSADAVEQTVVFKRDDGTYKLVHAVGAESGQAMFDEIRRLFTEMIEDLRDREVLSVTTKDGSHGLRRQLTLLADGRYFASRQSMKGGAPHWFVGSLGFAEQAEILAAVRLLGGPELIDRVALAGADLTGAVARDLAEENGSPFGFELTWPLEGKRCLRSEDRSRRDALRLGAAIDGAANRIRTAG